MFLGEPDPLQRVSRFLRRYRHPAPVVADLGVGLARPVRHPQPAHGPHHRVERDGQPAGRPQRMHLSVSLDVDIRLPVRDHHEAAAPKGTLNQLA